MNATTKDFKFGNYFLKNDLTFWFINFRFSQLIDWAI